MHLDLLLNRNPGFIEIRHKLRAGMGQAFFADPFDAVKHGLWMADTTDVYVGVLPRAKRGGGKDSLVPSSYWAWAELDTQASVVRALNFQVPPALMVRSSKGHAHAYWPLSTPLGHDMLERANRRLAWELGADPKATDAARILRLAGTKNRKREQAERVSMVHYDCSPNVLPSSLVARLEDPTPPRPIPTPRPKRNYGPDLDKEGLLAIPSREYIYMLAGREVLHNMAQCPFHGNGQERTPSLHVGGQEELWHCFGCDEGGDVFTFAAKLWGLDERTAFPEIKRRLMAALR